MPSPQFFFTFFAGRGLALETNFAILPDATVISNAEINFVKVRPCTNPQRKTPSVVVWRVGGGGGGGGGGGLASLELTAPPTIHILD